MSAETETRRDPARWRWSPAGMRAPVGKRVLYRGAQRLATAWENDDRTWSWRLEGEHQVFGPEDDQSAAQREAKAAAVEVERRRKQRRS